MSTYNHTQLGACKKTDCPEQCGAAFLIDKDLKDSSPVDRCAVCNCYLASHMPRVDSTATATPISQTPVSESKTSTNRVDVDGFRGATAETLNGARGTKTSSGDAPSFHQAGTWKLNKPSKSPFVQASQKRDENRRQSAEQSGINIPKFDPSEETVLEKLKNHTGRAPKRVQKKEATTPKPAQPKPTHKITVVVIPETSAAHRGEVRRPSAARFDILRRPENKYVREIQVSQSADSKAIGSAIMAAFEDLLPDKISEDLGSNGVEGVEPSDSVFHLMEVVSGGKRGAPSRLVANQWLQNGHATFEEVKRAFSKSQPSGIKAADLPICVYIVFTDTYEDLSVYEPKAETTKLNVEVNKKKRRRSSGSPQPATSYVPKKPKNDHDFDVDMEKVEKKKSSHKALGWPAALHKAKRMVANTHCAPYGSGFGGGYPGSKKWFATSLSAPYDQLGHIAGHANGLLTAVRSESLRDLPDVAANMISSDYRHVEIFTVFATLATWIAETKVVDDDEEELTPLDNPDFVQQFKLGPNGITLAVEALVALSVLIEYTSRMPGLSGSAYRELQDVQQRVAGYSQNIVDLIDFFKLHVPRRFWYPTCGLRQLEAVINLNRPILREHGSKAIKDSTVHQGFVKLHNILADDKMPSQAIKDHLEVFAGSATDPQKIFIEVLATGPNGLDLLAKLLCQYVEKRTIHLFYSDNLEVLGRFAMAVAWKLSAYLKRPRFYNHKRPGNVGECYAKRNVYTGNFEPVETATGIDKNVRDIPGVDDRWYEELIIPDIASRMFYKFSTPPSNSGDQPQAQPSSSPDPSSSSSLPLDQDPTYVRACHLANSTRGYTWDTFISRLKQFKHPNVMVRRKFEEDVKAAQGKPGAKKRQWASAQRTYHPDKNSGHGPIWEATCTQLNSAINTCFNPMPLHISLD